MIRFRFTKAKLRALETRAKRYDVWDTQVRGLAVTVMPAGTKVFYLVRKIAGKVERFKVGNIEDLKLPEARGIADKMIGEIATGDDPAKARRLARSVMTLGELWDMYLERHAKPRKRSWKNDVWQYQKHWSGWQSRRLSELDRSTVAERLAVIAKQHGPVAANRARALLSSMYSRAIEWGAEVPNPCDRVRRYQETPRERYLLPDELRRFLLVLDDPHGRLESDAAQAFQMMLFTGQRKTNVLGARWSHFNLPDRVWVIPGELVKSGRTLYVPLAESVTELLEERRQRTGHDAEYVFPSSGARGYLYDVRGSWARFTERSQLDDVNPHDLRRTHAQWMLTNGAGVEVVAKALGHADIGGVTAVYARVQLDTVRQAVERTVRAMLAAKAGEGSVKPVAEPDDKEQ